MIYWKKDFEIRMNFTLANACTVYSIICCFYVRIYNCKVSS